MGTEVRLLVPMASVASVETSIEFYAKLGFKVGKTFKPDDQARLSWAWLTTGSAQLMVSLASHPVDLKAQPILFYVYCDDVPAAKAELARQGVETSAISHPFYAPRGEFQATDPDGYTLMITHT